MIGFLYRLKICSLYFLANIHQEGEEEVVVVAQEALLHQEVVVEEGSRPGPDLGMEHVGEGSRLAWVEVVQAKLPGVFHPQMLHHLI